MTYYLDFQVDGDILRIDAKGDRSLESPASSAKDAWMRVAQKCRETGLSKVLIVSEVKGRYPVHDIYQVMPKLTDYGISKDWKIAYVNDDRQCREDLVLMMTVADNRGYRVRVFDDEADARKWLESGL